MSPPDHDSGRPALLYLPGVHGDDTLLGSFRTRLGNDLQLLTVTYPHSTTVGLADLAAEAWSAVRASTRRPVWLLAESFGSQVAWAMLAVARTSPDAVLPVSGLILAGGFVRHPMQPAVAMARRLAAAPSPSQLKTAFRLYSRWARFAYRHAPEVSAAIPDFVARRSEPADQAAMVHRLRLIRQNDPRPVAREVSVPVWQLTGRWDPVVPWPWVRSWLRRHCPGWRETVVVPGADHVVLATGVPDSVAAVRRWMGLTPP